MLDGMGVAGGLECQWRGMCQLWRGGMVMWIWEGAVKAMVTAAGGGRLKVVVVVVLVRFIVVVLMAVVWGGGEKKERIELVKKGERREYPNKYKQ